MGDKKEDLIERAKTSRSTCKDCGLTIEKGAIRFGLVDFAFSESGSYKYYHLTCANRRKPAQVEAAIPKAVDVPKEEIEAALAGGVVSSAPTMKAIPAWLSGAPAHETEDFGAAVAPPIKDGMALDAASVGKLVAALHRETTKKAPKKGDPSVAQFDEWLGKDEMRAFVWRLFEVWAQGEAHMRHKWLFRALTDRIDDALGFKLGAIIERWTKDNKKNAVEAGLEALSESGSEAALMVIQSLAQRFNYKGAHNLAANVLAGVAKERKLTVHELEDRLVPTLDLDADGSRAFDLGGRTLKLRVDGDLRVELEGEDKTRIRSFPAARKTDDATKLAQARAAFDLVKTELEALLKTQSARLELALSAGRQWKRADWEKYLLGHPVMKHLVKRLVWAANEPFIVDEEGGFMNEKLGATKLVGDAIHLVHPIELVEASRNAWSTILGDFQIIQPFPQLARGAHVATDGGDTVRTFPRTPVDPGRLHGVLNRLGWVKGPPDYMTVRTFYKHFVGLGVYGIIEIDPGMSVTGYGEEKQTATAALFAHEPPHYEGKLPERIKLADVSPVAVSEVLHALSALA